MDRKQKTINWYFSIYSKWMFRQRLPIEIINPGLKFEAASHFLLFLIKIRTICAPDWSPRLLLVSQYIYFSTFHFHLSTFNFPLSTFNFQLNPIYPNFASIEIVRLFLLRLWIEATPIEWGKASNTLRSCGRVISIRANFRLHWFHDSLFSNCWFHKLSKKLWYLFRPYLN